MTDDDVYALAMRSAPRPMTTEWLRSSAYVLLMLRHADPIDVDRHESRDLTPSYVFRHATAAHALGAWRWRGMQRQASWLVPLLDRSRFTVDFGGAASPLGCDSVVVDKAMTDSLGRRVILGDLQPIPSFADVLFSSHALEHCEDLDGTLHDMHETLVPGGKLVLMVPSWTCPRWRVGTHKAADHGDHVWDFGLEPNAPADVPLRNYANVEDAVNRAGFEVQSAAYCGDDSIMVIATKGERT